MEYAEYIQDENLIKYVGYSTADNPYIQEYFSKETLRLISKKVTQLLMGVDPKNRPIIVPDHIISNVMGSVQESFRPQTGDIYSRYNIPSGDSSGGYIQSMIDQTIEIITMDVKNNLEMEENNKKLTVWTTVYGDFNKEGLRQHPPIKILHKRPNPFEFHMNY